MVAICALVAKTVLLEKYVLDVVYLFIDPVWALSRPCISDFHASFCLVFCTTFLSGSDERIFERDSTLFFFLPSRRLSMWYFHTFHCAMLPPSSVGSAVFVLFCIIFTTSIIRQSCFATQTVGMPLTSQARRTIHFYNFYTPLLLIGFCAELSRLLYSPCAPLIVRRVWIAATTWLLTCIIQVCLVYLCPLNPRSFLAKPPP